MQMTMDNLNMARGKQTMEVLSGFLHNAKRTVEQLCESHNLASMQASKQRTSVAASAFGVLPTFEKGLSHDAMSHQVAGKHDQAQCWSFSSPTSTINERISERRGDYCSEATPLGFRRLPEVEMDRAVGIFLNDMRKTVDIWCSRYRLLAEGKVPMEGMPQPLHSDMQVMNQLGFGPDADHDYSVMADLDDRDNEVLLLYAPNRQLMGKPFVKKVVAANRGAKRKPSNARRKKPRASCLPQGTTVSMNTARSLDPSQQDTVSGQEPISNESQHLKNTAPNNHEPANGNVAEGAIVKFGSLGPDEKADAESPIQTDELTIRPHHYKVEVVESPDWLPKGWITELKTRSTGGSAGCKDKYYYDPVSKRRCRSQKEVFCFLETGKLGRYKRKNPQPANKVLNLDLEQQVSNSGEIQVAENEEVPGMRNAPSQSYGQDNTSATLGIFPGTMQRGWGGGTFLPYRPGQTADLLYDSLTNLSRPGLEQYRYMDPSSSKSGGDKSLHASRPWFLANADVPTGALVEMDNVIERAGGQGFGRGRRGADGAPKRGRKSTKRAVT